MKFPIKKQYKLLISRSPNNFLDGTALSSPQSFILSGVERVGLSSTNNLYYILKEVVTPSKAQERHDGKISSDFSDQKNVFKFNGNNKLIKNKKVKYFMYEQRVSEREQAFFIIQKNMYLIIRLFQGVNLILLEKK